MNILVLGGDGFLGSHFVDTLISAGHVVTVFDRFRYGVSRNLEGLRDRATLVSGEFANRVDVARALVDQDVVYHFVCATNPVTSWNDPFVEIDENVRNTVNLFDMAASSGVRKVVFLSSGGTVYGKKTGVVDEQVLPAPFCPYGIAKMTIEHYLEYFRVHRGIAADVFRIGNAYGPRQSTKSPQGVVAVWMGRIREGKEIDVFGGEDVVRDYIYVGDVAKLLMHSLADISTSDTYNLGSGRGVNLLELLSAFEEAIDRSIISRIHDRRESDCSGVVLNSDKLLSFFPDFMFSDLKYGLAKTWKHLKDTASYQ